MLMNTKDQPCRKPTLLGNLETDGQPELRQTPEE